MREPSPALAHFGASAFERLVRSFARCAFRAAFAFTGEAFGLVDFDSLDIAENHRLDIPILVLVEHRSDGRLIVDFVLVGLFDVISRAAFRHDFFRMLGR